MPDLDPKPPTERQRWIAAQCLAAGEGLAGAAAFAGIPLPVLRRLDAEDADFQALRDAEIARAALPADAWARRVELLTRQAVERALADGKVSTVNALLRLGLAFPAFAAQDGSPQARAAAVTALAALDGAPDGPDREEPASAEPPEPARPAAAEEPAGEARRQELLARIRPVLRPCFARAPLAALEQALAAAAPDPAAYEAWFARQPKPAPEPVPLGPEDQVAIRHVTRHNPPWLRGPHLGHDRPLPPEAAFRAEAAPAAAVEAAPAPPPPEPPAQALRRRLVRLLDRTAPRLAEELDLAEAVCAVLWPKWPAYQGPIDLFDLRAALKAVPVDADTLHWLGSPAFAQACRAAAAGPAMALGP